MKVRVYYNLHRHCLSVQHRTRQGWRVREHTDHITLADVTFTVSQAGRQRVLTEGRKNVHAFVQGTALSFRPHPANGTQVTYNPYRNETFVESATNQPVHHAAHATITGNIITIN